MALSLQEGYSAARWTVQSGRNGERRLQFAACPID